MNPVIKGFYKVSEEQIHNFNQDGNTFELLINGKDGMILLRDINTDLSKNTREVLKTILRPLNIKGLEGLKKEDLLKLARLAISFEKNNAENVNRDKIEKNNSRNRSRSRSKIKSKKEIKKSKNKVKNYTIKSRDKKGICKVDRILNPLSNRCILKKNSLGKLLTSKFCNNL